MEPTAIEIASSEEEEEEEDCLICLQPLLGGEEAVKEEWGCGHHRRFHPQCIQQWLASSPLCPVCRDVVVEEDEAHRRRREEEEEATAARRPPRRRGGLFRRYRDGVRDGLADGQRHACTRGLLFALSLVLAATYGVCGQLHAAACCLVAWSLMACQECAGSCSYLLASFSLFIFLHIWMCNWLGKSCVGGHQVDQSPGGPLCDNLMALVYGHLFVCLYGLMYTMSTSMQEAMRLEAALEGQRRGV